MGRRTYDVVAAMGEWVYGELPVLVPTHRALQPVAPTVRAVTGEIGSLIAQAREECGSLLDLPWTRIVEHIKNWQPRRRR